MGFFELENQDSDVNSQGKVYIYMLFTGWGVRIGRNSADGGTQPEGTVFPNMDRPRPVNNIFICFPTEI